MKERQKSAEVILPKKLWKHSGGKDRIFKAGEFFLEVVKARTSFEKQKG